GRRSCAGPPRLTGSVGAGRAGRDWRGLPWRGGAAAGPHAPPGRGPPGYRHAALEWAGNGPAAAAGGAAEQGPWDSYPQGTVLRYRGVAGGGGRRCLEGAGGGGHREGDPSRGPGGDLFEAAGHAGGGAGLFEWGAAAAGPADLAGARDRPAYRRGADHERD